MTTGDLTTGRAPVLATGDGQGRDRLAAGLRAALQRHSHLSQPAIADDAMLDGRVGLDSFALLNALLEVEDELGIEVEPSQLAGIREMTFTDLVDLLAASAAAAAVRAAGHAGRCDPGGAR